MRTSRKNLNASKFKKGGSKNFIAVCGVKKNNPKIMLALLELFETAHSEIEKKQLKSRLLNDVVIKQQAQYAKRLERKIAKLERQLAKQQKSGVRVNFKAAVISKHARKLIKAGAMSGFKMGAKFKR